MSPADSRVVGEWRRLRGGIANLHRIEVPVPRCRYCSGSARHGYPCHRCGGTGVEPGTDRSPVADPEQQRAVPVLDTQDVAIACEIANVLHQRGVDGLATNRDELIAMEKWTPAQIDQLLPLAEDLARQQALRMGVV